MDASWRHLSASQARQRSTGRDAKLASLALIGLISFPGASP